MHSALLSLQNTGKRREKRAKCAEKGLDYQFAFFGPTARKGEKWPKNGKMGIFDPFWGNLPIFRPFFPLFLGGAKIHFSAIFFPFRAGGPICTGQSGSQVWGLNHLNWLVSFVLSGDFSIAIPESSGLSRRSKEVPNAMSPKSSFFRPKVCAQKTHLEHFNSLCPNTIIP